MKIVYDLHRRIRLCAGFLFIESNNSVPYVVVRHSAATPGADGKPHDAPANFFVTLYTACRVKESWNRNSKGNGLD